jgi:hypothetical protein
LADRANLLADRATPVCVAKTAFGKAIQSLARHKCQVGSVRWPLSDGGDEARRL